MDDKEYGKSNFETCVGNLFSYLSFIRNSKMNSDEESACGKLYDLTEEFQRKSKEMLSRI